MTETPHTSADGLDDLDVERWLSGGPAPDGFVEVATALAGVTASADRLRPTPNDKLARFLEAGSAVPRPAQATTVVLPPEEPKLVDLADQRRRRGRRAGTTTALAIALALTSVGAAAAAGRLPDPAQNAISRVVGGLTPFSLPSAPAHRQAQPLTPPAAPPAVPPAVSNSGAKASPEPSASDGEPVGAAPAGRDGVADATDEGSSSSPSQDGEHASPETTSPAGTDSGQAGSEGAGPTGSPEPGDSSGNTGTAVRSEPAASQSPADDQTPPSQEPASASDSADGTPAD